MDCLPSIGKRMADRVQVKVEKPTWNQAAIWTGADLFGLLRILNANRWQIHPLHVPGVLIDLAFATGNTGLKLLQSLAYGGRIRRAPLGEDPIFIIGHWRTGTTLLHELLALDPRHHAPTTFQCFVPNHFLLSERLLKPWSGFVLPPGRPPDGMKMAWDLPQEDEFALCNLGVPSIYSSIAFPNRPPGDADYLELEAVSPRQRERWMRTFEKFLRQVSFRNSGRLVLKSPHHTFRLPILLEMFPNARFINIVRHPIAVFLSTVRLWKTLYATHGYQKPRNKNLDEFVFSTFTRMHERLEATRELIPAGHLAEVRYEDLIRDIPHRLRTIYEQLELGDFERVRPLVDDYVAAHAEYQPSRYQPSDELQSEIYRRWRAYFDRYGYEPHLKR